MKNKIIVLFFIVLFLSGCVGVASRGIFGTGVSIAFDPRSVGTQVDDSIMQKNLSARILLESFTNSDPAWVKLTWRVVLKNSRAPNSCSKADIRSDRADWLNPRRSPARRK